MGWGASANGDADVFDTKAEALAWIRMQGGEGELTALAKERRWDVRAGKVDPKSERWT